jgi:hypothetical protein
LAQRFEQKNPFFFIKIIKKEKALQLKVKGPVIICLPGWISENVFLGNKIGLEMKRARAGLLEKFT